MTIWLIEDESEPQIAAKTAIKNVDAAAEPLCIEDFKLPDNDEPAPDIVILDLYKSGTEFKGEEIYDELRERKSGAKTFVIVWSAYRGFKLADEFVNRCANDRFAAVNNKSRGDLEEILTTVCNRIQREMGAI